MDNSNQLAIEIGARLRTWRRSLGMTQEDMAVRLQVNPSTYKRYELGLNAPGAPVLHEACGLGVNTNWLLNGTPPMVRMAKSSGCDSTDSVLEELCCSLNNLRLLDPEKYAILTRGFVARSAEAAEHAVLKKSMADTISSRVAYGFEDILKTPMDLLNVDGTNYTEGKKD